LLSSFVFYVFADSGLDLRVAYEAALYGVVGSLGAVVRLQFLKDGSDVVLDCLFRQEEFIAYTSVARACRYERQ